MIAEKNLNALIADLSDDQEAAVWAKDSANLVLTRNALGEWSLNRTAAGAETYNCSTCIPSPIRTRQATDFGYLPKGDVGFKLLSIDLLYAVGVVNLTSITPVLKQVTLQDNVAVAVADHAGGLSGAPTVTQRAAPYRFVLTPVTPVIWTDKTKRLVFEVQFVMANTGTLKFYGATFNWSFLL